VVDQADRGRGGVTGAVVAGAFDAVGVVARSLDDPRVGPVPALRVEVLLRVMSAMTASRVRSCWPAGQVASAQALSRRARPRPVRLRRFSAAVRRLSQAWVFGGAAVAELEPAPAPGGDLGDHPFHVGPVRAVILAQPRAARPGGAGGAQQVIARVQVSTRPDLEVVHRGRSGQPWQAAPKTTCRDGGITG
jgi:hypothetical protein